MTITDRSLPWDTPEWRHARPKSLNPTTFPPLPRLAANLAGTEGFLFGGEEALANGLIRVIHVDAQPTKFLLDLQYFKLASGCVLECGDLRLR
jgi:hypothetical protein